MQDELFMREALRVARNAAGRTSPNPLVGAVIVRDGRIIAQGWHRKAGTPHAEIHALNMAGELARGATVYVTLEPCSHYGRTGPCAKALVEAGVARVVIAMTDPNPKVAGNGIKILEDAGIQVETGVLREEAVKLNEVFLKWITEKMPFVVMKTAMSLDGKIATATGQSQWITNEKSREYTHLLRDTYDGIMVGINTAIKDNPSLTTRLKDRPGKHPVRIVVDSKGRLPLDSKLVTDGAAKTIVAVSGLANTGTVQALESAGVEVIVAGDERVDLRELMLRLAQKDICSVLVEGGGQLNYSLLEQGLVDKVYAFIAPKLIGGRDALTPVEGEGFAELSRAVSLTDVETELIAGDILITAKVIK
ncbi:bifunctional diaminohydroxyphosphoribosylaminopyrimidine deaminase/5-amino-6-(5-phosphoribosylamino)uracil reductase RibD [Anaerovibrio sp.]|uniref:bifunctional diaminohydroxyphosphoribosylaminopyrimidine deaminase/5-amino-6-(5-phosphoribosylamino)uracil reductase RibD n=1 Tax=Anaerovibrio sp. TaxID=1872532 RepID=UPI0025EAB227|nr:bifunctional diaminohydroxyphosphoribosylaminopyrimidine deaminase/5-amino-6-(5-phosphoribosylamino)uracil reductase RibD [Anaerovibrio sp.]